MVKIFVWLIRCYQKIIRPLLPHACRFYPTCSQYAIDATVKYGVARGLFKALWRIVRCSPFSAGGHDPVR